MKLDIFENFRVKNSNLACQIESLKNFNRSWKVLEFSLSKPVRTLGGAKS